MVKKFLRGSLSSAVIVATWFGCLTDCSFAQVKHQEGIYPRIVIRNDIGLAGSATFAAQPQFNSVVGLGDSFGQFCSGVLVATNTVLTARHCGCGTGDQVRFGTSYNSPAFTATVQSVWNAPGSGLLSGSDFTIVRLNQNVSGAVATPMRLIDNPAALVGQEVALVGYGNTGVGSPGVTGWDGIRRGGTNVLDRYGQPVNSSGNLNGANILSTDFDNPTGTSNTLNWLGSSPLATTFEATTAGGDSGGPLMVFMFNEWVVAGVLSGGTLGSSAYGDISWWTGIAPYRTQIEAAGGVFAIPEPGSAVVLLLGTIAAGLRRNRQTI